MSTNATRLNALMRPFVTAIVPAVLLGFSLAIGYWAIDFASLFNSELRIFVRTLFFLWFSVFPFRSV